MECSSGSSSPHAIWCRVLTWSASRCASRTGSTCACRKVHPCSSSGMFVLVEDAAEALVSSYVQLGDLVRIDDRRGQWMEWAGVGDALIRPVAVVEVLELA